MKCYLCEQKGDYLTVIDPQGEPCRIKNKIRYDKKLNVHLCQDCSGATEKDIQQCGRIREAERTYQAGYARACGYFD